MPAKRECTISHTNIHTAIQTEWLQTRRNTLSLKLDGYKHTHTHSSLTTICAPFCAPICAPVFPLHQYLNTDNTGLSVSLNPF